MFKELNRKFAFAELQKFYKEEYMQRVGLEIGLAIFKVVAIIVSASSIAKWIGEPSVGGGPASLAVIIGIIYSVAAVYGSLENILKIKKEVSRKYRKDKIILMMELSE